MERALDVRELAPPEPMDAILQALDDLPKEDWLRVRLSREPFPLYAVLRDLGVSWRGRWTEDGFTLLIWQQDAPRVVTDRMDQW